MLFLSARAFVNTRLMQVGHRRPPRRPINPRTPDHLSNQAHACTLIPGRMYSHPGMHFAALCRANMVGRILTPAPAARGGGVRNGGGGGQLKRSRPAGGYQTPLTQPRGALRGGIAAMHGLSCEQTFPCQVVACEFFLGAALSGFAKVNSRKNPSTCSSYE